MSAVIIAGPNSRTVLLPRLVTRRLRGCHRGEDVFDNLEASDPGQPQPSSCKALRRCGWRAFAPIPAVWSAPTISPGEIRWLRVQRSGTRRRPSVNRRSPLARRRQSVCTSEEPHALRVKPYAVASQEYRRSVERLDSAEGRRSFMSATASTGDPRATATGGALRQSYRPGRAGVSRWFRRPHEKPASIRRQTVLTLDRLTSCASAVCRIRLLSPHRRGQRPAIVTAGCAGRRTP